MTDKPYWEPVLADADYAEHLREDYADDAHMSDDEILDEYCDGKKYVTLWDHLGDAYTDYRPLADAYLALQTRNKELEDQLVIDTLNPNRRKHIIDLVAQIAKLELDLACERYEHYETCESEGLAWSADIPKEPEGY